MHVFHAARHAAACEAQIDAIASLHLACGAQQDAVIGAFRDGVAAFEGCQRTYRVQHLRCVVQALLRVQQSCLDAGSQLLARAFDLQVPFAQPRSRRQSAEMCALREKGSARAGAGR